MEELSASTLALATVATGGDVAAAQRQWREVWTRAIKVEQLIRELDAQTAGRLYGLIGTRNGPGAGFHAMEFSLFGRTPDLARVATLATEAAADLDALRAATTALPEESILEAAFDAWRAPFDNVAGTTTPLAGADIDALRALLIGTSAYLELSPDLLSASTSLEGALDDLKEAVGADPVNDADELPGLLAASRAFQAAVLEAATARGLNINADAADVVDPLAIPRGEVFRDNFLHEEPEVIELGRLLFFDPLLSEAQDRACSSCHNPNLAWQDNRPKGLGLSGASLRRATPTILNAALQRGSFWDFRVDDLPSQALRPVEEAEEMGTDLALVFQRLGENAEYLQRFEAAFADGLQITNIAAAITAFEATLLTLDSPADRFLAGDLTALSSSEKRGLVLYFGKARCGNCHYAPIFGGTQAPTFATTDVRVIGVPETDDDDVISADIGFGEVSGDPLDDGGFKVPTLRNIAETGPYMHNGAFSTLREVINFYNAGGGFGLGYEVPNADPRLIELGLSTAEKDDLEAFLRALTDDRTVLPGAPASVPSGLPPSGRGF